MKRLLILIAFLLGLTSYANADVMPYYVNNINTDSIGVYQASHDVKIYKEANENSRLLLNMYWDEKTFECPDVSASNLFIVYLPKKDLAFLVVTDETEEWVQVVYNRSNGARGWLKKDDVYKFMNWRMFFNMYGRRYGVYYLKDAPEESKVLNSANAESSQNIGMINIAQKINLTTAKGNWLLVTAFDMDKTQKIGWIKWRDISGEIFLFPDIK